MVFALLNESVIYSDYWKVNEGLVDYKAKEYYMVKHLKSKFANAVILALFVTL